MAFLVKTRKPIVTGVTTQRRAKPAPTYRRANRYRKRRYRRGPMTLKSLRNLIQPARQAAWQRYGNVMNTAAAIASGTTHLVQDVTSILEGDGFDMREMPVINVKGVSIRGSFVNTDTKVKYVRIVLLSPKSIQGDLDDATLTNLLMDQTYAPFSYDKLSASLNLSINKERFKVYFDKAYPLIPQTNEGGCRVIKEYVKLKDGLEVGYDKDSGAATALVNKLWWVAFLCEPSNATTASNIIANMYVKTFFRDGHRLYVRSTMGA